MKAKAKLKAEMVANRLPAATTTHIPPSVDDMETNDNYAYIASLDTNENVASVNTDENVSYGAILGVDNDCMR